MNRLTIIIFITLLTTSCNNITPDTKDVSDDIEKNDFYLNDCISSLLFIIQSEFEYQNINIITDIKNLHLNTYENELKQVILNILNNAKDAILLKKEKLSFEAYIKIESRITDSEIIIKISNNGGEIEDDIMQ